jgi:2-polyprenyl-3-methyl-5-hydroxy-6-metoxy-1,4-benzoquinol methylase
MDASVYDLPIDPDNQLEAHGIVLAMVGGSKRVLEVGCGAGHVTRHLVARGNAVVGVEIDPRAAARAEQFAERVVVADLDQVDLLKAVGDDRFQVVVLSDVLEHLRDPLAALRAATQLLDPDGYLVVSVPNVAHIDLRLLHLEGRWEYHDTGLLDRTHLRFFTRSTLRDLVREAGLHVAELRQAFKPAFTTNLGVRRDQHAAELVEGLLAQPDAETYQFVARLVADDAVAATGDALDHVGALEDRLLAAEVQLASTHAVLERTSAERQRLESELAASRAEVQALRSSKTFRLTAPLRRVYAAVRTRRLPGDR